MLVAEFDKDTDNYFCSCMDVCDLGFTNNKSDKSAILIQSQFGEGQKVELYVQGWSRTIHKKKNVSCVLLFIF